MRMDDRANEWLQDNNFSWTTNETIRLHDIRLILSASLNQSPNLWGQKTKRASCSCPRVFVSNFLLKQILNLSFVWSFSIGTICGKTRKKIKSTSAKQNKQRTFFYVQKSFLQHVIAYKSPMNIFQHQMNILMKIYLIFRVRN